MIETVRSISSKRKIVITFTLLVFISCTALSQEFMTNVYGRNYKSLNGKWNALVDPYDYGLNLGVPQNRKPKGDTDFVEYSFENALQLNVPSDWNSQIPKLYQYEGTVWYGKYIDVKKSNVNRQFIYFGSVNYRSRIYLNGKMIKKHEGGFTPFQVEITDFIKDEEPNFLVVEANNARTVDAIPAMSFDWWNYGGITRDVLLVSAPRVYIHDYFIQLNKYKTNQIDIKIKLSDKLSDKNISIEIPELNIKTILVSNNNGEANASIRVKKLIRWSPDFPKLYTVIVSSEEDRIEELIGFRNLYVKGTNIYINDKPIYCKGINFHEEIAQRKGRAFSEADAAMLLSEAKALGANMIRLAHYPQNEYIVRMAEKMGFLLWEEIPVWQGIDFANSTTLNKADNMLKEMLNRDKNRCAITFWGIANETKPSTERNEFLKQLAKSCREIDTTRLVSAAFDTPKFNKDNNTFELTDSITKYLDVVAVNKYIGWYNAWPVTPDNVKWDVAPDKPLIFSEFGGEALYGKSGNAAKASSWTEEYQEKLYKDNLVMFSGIENLRGICPWALFDFRSPLRLHPTNQDGWNRKGLVSEQGFRKKAWYIMKEHYKSFK